MSRFHAGRSWNTSCRGSGYPQPTHGRASYWLASRHKTQFWAVSAKSALPAPSGHHLVPRSAPPRRLQVECISLVRCKNLTIRSALCQIRISDPAKDDVVQLGTRGDTVSASSLKKPIYLMLQRLAGKLFASLADERVIERLAITVPARCSSGSQRMLCRGPLGVKLLRSIQTTRDAICQAAYVARRQASTDRKGFCPDIQ